MEDILSRYVPKLAVKPCIKLIKTHQLVVQIVNERITKHGDYRRLPNGQHKITVNAMSNPYKFLITLLHEIAHAMVREKYISRVTPHGAEWKHEFQKLMLPFINPNVFPEELLPLLARHFKNPKASHSVDVELTLAMDKYSQKTGKNKIYISQLPSNTVFTFKNGQRYQLMNKLVKNYKCQELSTGRTFIFAPHAEVKVQKN